MTGEKIEARVWLGDGATSVDAMRNIVASVRCADVPAAKRLARICAESNGGTACAAPYMREVPAAETPDDDLGAQDDDSFCDQRLEAEVNSLSIKITSLSIEIHRLREAIARKNAEARESLDIQAGLRSQIAAQAKLLEALVEMVS